MSKQPYKKPPITEALVEIRCAPKIAEARVQRLAAKFHSLYPQANEHKQFQVSIDANTKQTLFNLEAAGVRMATLEQTEILVILDDRFIRSHLAPYPGWDDFRDTIVRDWQRWRPIAKPTNLTRVGMRYVNRVDVPWPAGTPIHLEEYFRFYPEFPEGVFGHSDYIACQQRFDIGADECRGLLNLVSAPAALIDHYSFVLDLDISRAKDVPQDNDDLFELLELMRGHKNRLFETVITDKARDLFQR